MQKRRYAEEISEEKVNHYGFGSSKPNTKKINEEFEQDAREEEPSVINLTEYNVKRGASKNRRPFEGVSNINAASYAKKRKLNFK